MSAIHEMVASTASDDDHNVDDGIPVDVTLPNKDNNVDSAMDNNISNPITTEFLDFCETEIYPETNIQNNSKTTSSSDNCSYDENSFNINLAFASDTGEKFSSDTIDFGDLQTDQNETTNNTMANPTTTATPTPTSSTTTNTTNTATVNTNNNNNNTVSIIFDSQDELGNDISASIDFSTSPPPFNISSSSYLNNMSIPTNQQDNQFDFSSLHQQPSSQIQFTDYVSMNGLTGYNSCTDPPHEVPLMGSALPSVFEEDCLSTMPSFFRMNNHSGSSSSSSSSSYPYLDPALGPYLSGALNAAFGVDNPGMFGGGGVLLGSELQGKEPDYHGDNGGVYCPDQLPRVYNSGDHMQAISGDNGQMVNGSSNSAPISTDISNLDDSTFKVGKLSVEQRKEKINKYMDKRNKRNFTKKIKYACRKILADSRPRVRGRFAKNDDSGEAQRHGRGNPEEDEYNEAAVKEEEDLVNSSDILAHLSGVNSFKCGGYPVPSWI